MKRVVLTAVLAGAVACGGVETIVPGNTAAPFVVSDGGPTKTPASAKGWTIEDWQHTGDRGEVTVVTIRYFNTVQVSVTYDERQPDERVFEPPLEHFTFRGTGGGGGHNIVARDADGMEETIRFSIGPPSGAGPAAPSR